MTFVEYRPNLSITEGKDTGSGWHHHHDNVGSNWLGVRRLDEAGPGFFVAWYYPTEVVITDD